MTETKTLAVDIEAINLLAEKIAQTGGSLLDRVNFDSETSTYSTTLRIRFLDTKLSERVTRTAELGEQLFPLLSECDDDDLYQYAMQQCQMGKILFLVRLTTRFYQKRYLSLYLGIVFPAAALLVLFVLSWLLKNFRFF